MESLCHYCSEKASGPMLTLGNEEGIYPEQAHVRCVIRKLNELLDPDYDESRLREPSEIVGFLDKLS